MSKKKTKGAPIKSAEDKAIIVSKSFMKHRWIRYGKTREEARKYMQELLDGFFR
jgi:hypothetical protein